MFVSVGMSRAHIHASCEHFIHTIFSHAHVSPRKTGVAGRNPLTAPARALPAGHITLAEALLSGLDHPWPHRERPATTRARSRMVLLATHLWKGFAEAQWAMQYRNALWTWHLRCLQKRVAPFACMRR